jgi:predicted nucleotidyltransferase
MVKRVMNEFLSEIEAEALEELKGRLFEKFEIEGLMLYGSAVRGESDEESDIDVLVVTKKPLTRTQRHEITDIAFEVNLRYGTNLSTLVVDRAAWESGLLSIMPLRDEILKEGIPL